VSRRPLRITAVSYREYYTPRIEVDGYEAPPASSVVDYNEIGPGSRADRDSRLALALFTRHDDERRNGSRCG